MSLAERSDIEDFAEEVREALDGRVEEIVLFGSCPTDDYVPGSDIDVAILVSDIREGDEKKIWDLAEDYRVEEGLDFAPKLYEKEKFDEKVEKGFSFYTEVREQGVEL